MHYLCLAYEQEETLNALDERAWRALREETLDYVEDLRRRGIHVTSAALRSVKTASTVRVRDGRVTVTDGPFAETRETLGGIVLIEARDLNEALQVAAGWPSARLGSIEVRPIEDELPTERRYRD